MIRTAGTHHRSFLLLTVVLVSLVPAVVAWAGGPLDSLRALPTQTTVDAVRNKPSAASPSESDSRSLKELPRDILRDQKFLWLRPFRMKRSDVPWAGAIVGTTAGLIAIDRPVGQELSENPPGDGFAFSRRVGQFGGLLTDYGIAAGFYVIGRWRGDKRMRATGVLGLRAVTDSLIIVEILKTASQRPRPTRDDSRLRNHNADGEFFTGGRSFPSGHAAQAWALATVVAHQYRHRGWVPPTAYGLAGLVAVARVTQRKHFPADIFVGSVLGYLIGRHVAHSPCVDEEMPRRWHLISYVPMRGGATLALTWEF